MISKEDAVDWLGIVLIGLAACRRLLSTDRRERTSRLKLSLRKGSPLL